MDLLPREETEGSEQKLRRKDKIFILACVVISAITLAIGFKLYPTVNPEASIRFVVDRGSSQKVALDFLKQLEVDAQGYRHAGRFTYDGTAKTFLERTVGQAQANQLMAGPVRMWRWGHRWFRPLQKEEISVEVATTGQIAAFSHPLAEDAAGADLSPEAARGIAEHLLAGPLGVELSGLVFQDVKSEKRPHRTDHTFTWKRLESGWADGNYRLEVLVEGDQPGGYREYVKVPEAWSRDYAQLRSRNESAGSVAAGLLLLTLVAVLVVLLMRVRLRDIRWRTALIFGLIGGGLFTLAGLNGLPNALYGYDTTASFGGFLITRIFYALLAGLGAAVAIFVLTAAAESLYREAYPGKISLSQFFTKRGLRTRRFLLSSVLGLTLTCFFFFYQEIFYTIAMKLGAWAPMEVPYDDLLNTAIPWVFVLLIGFWPAVSEEFSSRMFSIPFLQKYTRSTWLAVIIPAFIWGFAHSNYPNQPFYIRGLEVGFAGILVGVIMLRVNIMATLIWHFTVDALYTSYLLFRSGNLYYILSAALASGLILLPLGFAVVGYLRRGRFEEPADLLNRVEPGPQAPVMAAGEGRAEAEPAIGGEGESGEIPAPWSGRRRVTVLASAAASLLLLFVPSQTLDDAAPLRVGRPAALEAGSELLRGLGESPDSFRVAILGRSTTVEADLQAKYILQQAGVERLREEYSRFLPPLSWKIRYYRPLQTREVTLWLDTDSGRLLALTRHIAEKDSLPSMESGAAEALARGFLEKQGVDLATLEQKESSQEKRPHRIDHTFLWEAREGDPRNVALAHHRVKVVVQGNEIGAYEQFLKLPEDWVRAREKRTALGAIRLMLVLGAAGTGLGLLLWLLIDAHRAGRIRWKRILIWAVPFALLSLAGIINGWPMVLTRYDTAIPWNVFLVSAGVGLALGVVMGYLLAVLSIALATAAWPQAWSLVRASIRRPLLPDALLGTAAAVAFAFVLPHLEGTMLRLWPALAVPSTLRMPLPASSSAPWLGIVYNVIRSTFPMLGLAAGLLALLHLRTSQPRWTWLLLALAIVAMVPLGAKSGGEFLLGLAWTCLEVGVLLAVARWLLAGNLLALPLMVYVLAAVRGVMPFLGAEGTFFRWHGGVATVVLALPLEWLLVTALWRRGEKGRGSMSSVSR